MNIRISTVLMLLTKGEYSPSKKLSVNYPCEMSVHVKAFWRMDTWLIHRYPAL